MSSVLNTCMRCRSLRRKLILEFLGRAEAWWEKSAFFFFHLFIHFFVKIYMDSGNSSNDTLYISGRFQP